MRFGSHRGITKPRTRTSPSSSGAERRPAVPRSKALGAACDGFYGTANGESALERCLLGQREHPQRRAAIRRAAKFRHERREAARVKAAFADDDRDVLLASGCIADRARARDV